MSINEHSKVWEGVYQSFSDVKSEKDDTFEGLVWIDKLLNRAKSLMDETEQDGTIPKVAITSDYALSYVAAMASQPRQTLRILDFGGGLGTSYIPLLAMLRDNVPIEFVVVENKTICEKGNEYFSDDKRIQFYDSIPQAESFHIVHAGSSIHYVDDWRAVIGDFADTGAEYLLFADLPAGDIETFVTAQWFHGNKLPVWFWNIKEFVSTVEGFYFDLILKANYQGYYLDKNSVLPTSHFDSRHRLKQFCQLIFKRK